jgi:hypothetical protein
MHGGSLGLFLLLLLLLLWIGSTAEAIQYGIILLNELSFSLCMPLFKVPMNYLPTHSKSVIRA